MNATKMLELIALANTCKRMGSATFSVHKMRWGVLPDDSPNFTLVVVTPEGVRRDITLTASNEEADKFNKMMDDLLMHRNPALMPVVAP